MAIVLLSVMLGVPVFGASLGESLKDPEKDWKRQLFINNEHYSGDISNHSDKGFEASPGPQNSKQFITTIPNQKLHFKFKGTQLRILGAVGQFASTGNTISIDGNIETFSSALPVTDPFNNYYRLLYEKVNLEDKIHEVTITSGQSQKNNSWSIYVHGIDVNSDGQLVSYQNKLILDITPEKSTINLNETVTANLEINNIKNIAAEDILINYDQTKLEYVGMEEISGIKMVHLSDDKAKGHLRLILASQGEANIVNTKKILLKLKFKGIHAGDGLIDITKAKVADGITLEKDLLAENCGQATITIIAASDVNRSGEYTLLDLSIDARHFGKDPKSAELSSYETDVVINNAIDNADLLKIAQEMLANSNYVFKN
jgi:hypothetical protein